MLNHARMIITCPECATRYQINALAFPDEGRDVKCSSCDHGWFQDYEGLEAAELPEGSDMGEKGGEFAKPASDQPPEADGAADEGEGHQSRMPEPEAPVNIEQQASRLLRRAKTFRSKNNREMTEYRSRSKKILLLIACLVILGAIGIKNRMAIVKKVPETAILFETFGAPVNVRGLTFRRVEAIKDFQNGIPVLAITGEIRNITDKTQPTSALRYALYNESSQEVYHWVVPLGIKTLGPGTSYHIAARLAAPPADAAKLEVRFVRDKR